MLSTMAFVIPNYENNVVDIAGDALINLVDAVAYFENENLDYQYVINNWRAAHQYPQMIFRNTLANRIARVDPTGIAVGRNKRLSSIKSKLDRYDWLKLSDMQDIAGCRAIVSSVPLVDELVEGYKRKYESHRLVDESDYIRNPKSDGYRSYHLVYRYVSQQRPDYDGLKVEIQFRSQLQHCWATAVETTDIFYREGLKSHRGSPEWRRFFALMGEAIALQEGTKHVPRTPRDRNELVSELRALSNQLNVQTQLNAFQTTLNVVGETDTRRMGIKQILLVLEDKENGQTDKLSLYGYQYKDLETATKMLEREERLKDAVLVSVSDAAQLRRAFPNYYFDTSMFLETLGNFIS